MGCLGCEGASSELQKDQVIHDCISSQSKHTGDNWTQLGGCFSVMSAADDKFAEQVFNGSLAIQVILIAAVGIVAASYEKLAGIPVVELKLRWFLWGLVALSVLGCAVSLLAAERIRGHPVNIVTLVWLLRMLIVGTAATSIALALVTIF